MNKILEPSGDHWGESRPATTEPIERRLSREMGSSARAGGLPMTRARETTTLARPIMSDSFVGGSGLGDSLANGPSPPGEPGLTRRAKDPGDFPDSPLGRVSALEEPPRCLFRAASELVGRMGECLI
ncbi:MAG: hypothetical protein AAF690_20790, partial [Acidobacteriota bacterium]